MSAPRLADVPNATRSTGGTARWVAFATVCLIAVGLIGVALVLARGSGTTGSGPAPATVPAGDTVVLGDSAPRLLFESTGIGDDYGRIATVPLDAPGGARRVSDLECERVDFRAGSGLCLRSDRGFTTSYEAIGFGATMEPTFTLDLAGTPSRVRISPSGAMAGITVFVTGHSYAETGFSTQTTLIDIARGRVLADLEVDFTVSRDGNVWREVDFNFWGVTFVDDDEFFATLGSGGDAYLVRGDIAERSMSVVRPGVECPSLSPDGRRIAYKVRSDTGVGPLTWRVAVLDLATDEVTMLAETANVDDQVAWLDDDTVMYGVPRSGSPAETDTWSVAADGSGVPRLFVPSAWSTVVVGL